MDVPHPDSKSIDAFLQWRDAGALVITPKFQRRGVWTPQQRSYFIDTMLREMPSPPLYLRNIYDTKKKKVIHEVIDGQQRLSAVLDFYDSKYALSPTLEAKYKGKRYDKLTAHQQGILMRYRFNCAAFDAITDTEVFEIFRRLNTWSSPLTKQELRHGNWFGYFSQTAEELAMEHLPFWEANRILSDRQITRMLEVQLTAELLISEMDGIQDKKGSIDDFYRELDKRFTGRKR
ncbi:MAG TPA: DUF262 domain-containing protein, partial [Planctomycetaceae bacterium]|nr:DUF262 domain-containing protein [Planctomycetaceae bacterium]